MPVAAGWRGQPVAREAIQIGCVRSLRVGFSDCSRPFDAAYASSAPLGRKHASLEQAGGWPVRGVSRCAVVSASVRWPGLGDATTKAFPASP